MIETSQLFFVVAVLLGLMGVHPFLTYPLSLLLLPKRINLTASVDGARPRISLCMCARNEEPVLRKKLENLMELCSRYPELEILLYLDGCTDGSAAVAREFLPNITLVESSEWRGKSHGMQMLVAAARGEIFAFTDANTYIDSEAIKRAAAHFADSRLGCLAGSLKSINERESASSFVSSKYWELEEWIKRRESRIGCAMGADGSLFFVRRHFYRPAPVDVIDDLYVSLSVLAQGALVVQAHDVVSRERVASDARDEFRRKIRIACRVFNCHRKMWPHLRNRGALVCYMYLSHRFMRWMSGFSVAGATVATVCGLWARFPEGLGKLGFVVVLVGGLGALAAIPPMRSIVLGLTATSIGIGKSLRGERFQTWTPPRSAR